jgi:hypothetical protein
MAGLKSLFTNQADPRFTNQEPVVYEVSPEKQFGMPNNQLVSMDQEKMFSSEKMGTQLTPKEGSVVWDSRDQFANKNQRRKCSDEEGQVAQRKWRNEVGAQYVGSSNPNSNMNNPPERMGSTLKKSVPKNNSDDDDIPLSQWKARNQRRKSSESTEAFPA